MSRFRIFVDEAGTHGEEWLIIGMLFVPDHGSLHSDLCKAKDNHSYFNRSPKYSSTYKETHLAKFRSRYDLAVGKEWVDLFIKHTCYFRCVVIDWAIWDGVYFGGAFEPEPLKKRRAYKKWAEMLLHPEIREPCLGKPIYHAKLYLDRLRIMYTYDVLEHLEERFKKNYQGESPYIEEFQHTDSWKDANQCLQLCDLLTGCQYQALVPSTNQEKLAMRDYLALALRPFGVKRLDPSFWRGYASTTLTKNFPKFSSWFWRPTEEGKKRVKRNRH
ncbi:MAG: DUF3800 domain-containing protein [Planctomycetes bacterium]|nr:DUF3800 domain-containing protein [Planctomycetota bacterium]